MVNRQAKAAIKSAKEIAQPVRDIFLKIDPRNPANFAAKLGGQV